MIIVRKASKKDLHNIAKLEGLCMSEPWSYDNFVSAFNNDASYLFVAEDEKESFAGFAVAYFSWEQGELPTIAVGEDYRGQGVGRLLLSAVMSEAKKQGIEEFFLEVRPSNVAAVELYKKEGFEQIGVRKDFYTDPVEDAFLMKKILNL